MRSKKAAPLLAVFLLCSAPLWARVNILEPWSPGVDFDIPKNEWTHGADLRLGSGKTDLTELSYHLERVLNPVWEVGGTLGYRSLHYGGTRGTASGIGDLAVAAKYSLSPVFNDPSSRMIGELGLSLPTGDPDKGLGAGGVGFLFGWGLQTPIQRVMGYSHLGVQLFTDGNDTRFGNVFSYALGASYGLDSQWTLSGDLRGFSHGKDRINGVRAPDSVQELYLAPGARWKPAGLPFTGFGNLLIGLSSDSYDWGLMAGVKF